MSLSVLRLAEQDHPLPRTSRRWSVGHAQGGEVCPTRNGIRRCRGLDFVYLRLPAFLSDCSQHYGVTGTRLLSAIRFRTAALHLHSIKRALAV